MENLINKVKAFREIIRNADDPYMHYHAKRFEHIIRFIGLHLSPEKKILDVGNSPFSEVLSQIFETKVDELGFLPDNKRNFGRQFQFDLNDSYSKSSWRNDFGQYDLIIFTEVIEHLYTSPLFVLGYLHSLLREKGKIILQTPNAAVFHKRISLLFGNNPYMLIRETREDPGHFREYTKSELRMYAVQAGFKIEKISYGNYFDYQYSLAQSEGKKRMRLLKFVNIIYDLFPPSWKPGITMILSK